MIRTIMDHIASLSHISSSHPPLSFTFTSLHLLYVCQTRTLSIYLSVECHNNLLAYLKSLLDYAGDLKCILDLRGRKSVV